jgi:carbon starvation protein
MARVFIGLAGLSTLLAYWVHFAFMFVALFILTTLDTGTRIGRFLLQEFIGRYHRALGRADNHAGSVLATLAIVVGFTYFILTGSISTIWPMFGIANQLLACAALCVGTTIILREASDRRYALVTLLPLAFVATTTITAGVQSIFTIYLPLTDMPATRVMGFVNLSVTTALLVGVSVIIFGCARRWLRDLERPRSPGDIGARPL